MNRMRRIRILHRLVIALVILGVAGHANAQKKLQWNFEKGQQRQFEIVQNIEQVVNEKNLNSTTTIYLSSTVDDVNEDGSAAVTKTITRTAISITLADGSLLEYDSSLSEPPRGSLGMFAQILKPLIGWQMQMTVATDGSISNVKLLTPTKPSQINSGLFMPMLKSGQIEQALSKLTFAFADDELIEGKKWQSNKQSAIPIGPATLSSETTYTYRGQQEENGRLLDRFDVQTTLTANDQSVADGRPAIANPTVVTVSNQRSTGEVLFDANSSVVVRSKAEQALTLVYKVAGGEIRQSLTISTSQKSLLVEPVAPIEDQAIIEPVADE